MPGRITRRRAATGLAALGGTALLSARAGADDLLEAARREGTLTWYIAQVDGETAGHDRRLMIQVPLGPSNTVQEYPLDGPSTATKVYTTMVTITLRRH